MFQDDCFHGLGEGGLASAVAMVALKGKPFGNDCPRRMSLMGLHDRVSRCQQSL